MTVSHGFDPGRDRWSQEATERLLPPLLEKAFGPNTAEYAWNNPDLRRIDTHYGVDALLQCQQRNVALAIRLRGAAYYVKHGDITLRYDSLQTAGKFLEVRKSIARYLFYGWADTDLPAPPSRLQDWHVIWLQELVDAYLSGTLQYTGPFSNGDKSSRLIGVSLQELRRRHLVLDSAPQRPLLSGRMQAQMRFEQELMEGRSQ